MDMGFGHWMALESAMRGEEPGRTVTWALVRRIAAFARPHRRSLVAFVGLSVVSAVLSVGSPRWPAGPSTPSSAAGTPAGWCVWHC